MSSTRNEAGLAFARKTTFEKWLLEATTLIPSCIPVPLVCFQTLNLVVAGRRPTESCALNRKFLTSTSVQGPPTLHSPSSTIYREPQPMPSHLLLILSSVKASRPYYSRRTSSWPNTTAHSPMRSRSPLPREPRLSLTLWCPQSEKRSRGFNR